MDFQEKPVSASEGLRPASEKKAWPCEFSDRISSPQRRGITPVATADPSLLQCATKISICEARRYCTFCGKKRKESKLNLVSYKLLKKTAWHCKEHTSTSADFLQIISGTEGKFLELFSGSGEVAKIAGKFGLETFTVDYNPALKPDLTKDIRRVNLTELPKQVKLIWASIPCTVFSVLSISTHWEKVNYSWRQYFYVPKTKEAREAIQIVEKTLWLIKKLKPEFFVIENPRGGLRHLPQLRSIPFRHTVSYLDYGFDYYKPTDIFTNFPGLQLVKMKPKEEIDCAGSVLALNSAYQRSLVPGQLVESILSQILGKEAANG
jgi:hypothetical protein